MKKHRYFPMLFGIFLLCAAIVALPLFSAGAQTAQEKMAEAQKKIQEYDKQLAELKENEKETAKAKQLLDQQAAVIHEKIELLKVDIANQEAAIIEKQAEHDQKVIKINKEQSLLDSRLTALYMSRNTGLLGPMLGATSYTDAMVIADSMQRIANADTQFLDELARQKAEIEEEQRVLDEQMAQLQATKDELEATQQKLAWNIQQKKKDLTDIAAMQEATQEERDKAWEAYQAAIKEAEAEFNKNNGMMGGEFVSGKFIWPLPGYNSSGNITSGYGYRSFPLGGSIYSDFHTGIDISGGGVYGAPIVAAADGYVTAAVYGSTGYGIRVYVDHGGGYVTRYAHCSALYVGEGDYVSAGQTIAAVGSTGFSTGAHLHFEIRVNGSHTNPLAYF
ncbi:MAG: peptidoglycan DD-metalloendopeptidase family protein [Oscillospiraceae bacterium]|nr:peptidoglycan DD-metalloendopeptidase family protein [Oscillospiraceae bacterium]